METELTSVEKLLENDLTSFGKGFSVFETVSANTVINVFVLLLSYLGA